jgi:hypothetical protein
LTRKFLAAVVVSPEEHNPFWQKGGESMSQEHKVYQVTVTFFVCAASQARAEEEILMGYGASGKLEAKVVTDAAVVAKNQGSVMHAHDELVPY